MRTTYENLPSVVRSAGSAQAALWPPLADARERSAAAWLGSRAAAVGLFCMAVERAEVRRA